MSEERETPVGDTITERDKVALFIGPNAPKYLGFYDELVTYEDAVGKRKYSPDGEGNGTAPLYPPVAVNFAAFWISPFWLVYRKLYLVAFGWTSVLVAITYVYFLLIGDWSLRHNLGSGFGLWVIASSFAAVAFEKHYIVRARKLIAIIESQNLTHDIERDLIRRKGGTSAPSVCVYVFALIAFAATSIGFDRYNATQTLNECEDESLDPIAHQGVVKLLTQHNVTYQDLEARSVRQDLLHESSEYERVCGVLGYIDGESIIVQLIITWTNEVGGEKSFEVEDRNEAIPGLLRARENTD